MPAPNPNHLPLPSSAISLSQTLQGMGVINGTYGGDPCDNLWPGVSCDGAPSGNRDRHIIAL